MFTDAAFRCGAQLTRRCVIDQLKRMGPFSLGGFIAPKRPGQQTPYSADLLSQVRGDRFVELAAPAGMRGPRDGPDFWDSSVIFNWRDYYCGPGKSRFINTAAKDKVIRC